MAQEFSVVGAAEEIPPNGSKACFVDGQDILVCHTRDGFFAVENQCSHQHQKLEGGKIRGCFIFCPLHGQRFNLKTGEAIGQLTDTPLATYAVKVEEGRVWVATRPSVGAPD